MVDLIWPKSAGCRISFRQTPVWLRWRPSVAKGEMMKNVNASTLVLTWDGRAFAFENIYFSLWVASVLFIFINMQLQKK